MKKFFHIAALAALTAGLLSCNKAASTDATGTVSIRFTAESETRASDTDALPGEVRLESVEVFLFRASSDPSITDGRLEVRRHANGGEIAEHLLRMEVTPGTKHIYVVANAPAGSLDKVTDEASLKAVFSRFVDNRSDAFVMVGTPGKENIFTAGADGNGVEVILRRLAARVTLGKVSAAFTSRHVQESDFRIRRVYLTYVPKRAVLVNGDVEDAFGKAYDAELDGKQYKDYYDYEAPVAGADRRGTAENGFLNPGVLTGGKVVIDKAVEGLTSYTLGSDEGRLFSRDKAREEKENTWTPKEKLYFYTDPNSSTRTFEERVHDFTTKLVIEAELEGEVFWYPIPIPYTQPNWAYTVNGVTLTTKGSDDPNLPVTSRQMKVNVTVSDWTTGEIVGSYNQSDEHNGFIF